MPQSLARIVLHVIFSTKNRAPFLGTAASAENCMLTLLVPCKRSGANQSSSVGRRTTFTSSAICRGRRRSRSWLKRRRRVRRSGLSKTAPSTAISSGRLGTPLSPSASRTLNACGDISRSRRNITAEQLSRTNPRFVPQACDRYRRTIRVGLNVRKLVTPCHAPAGLVRFLNVTWGGARPSLAPGWPV